MVKANHQAMCRHLTEAVLMNRNNVYKKGGLKHFRKVIDKARMHATAAQRVAIARAMEQFSDRKVPTTVLALARMIPYASRTPAVMKRITRLEKRFFKSGTSPDANASRQTSLEKYFSATSPDANASRQNRPWWEVLGVSADCDALHVRKACRAKVLRWIKETHPYKGGQRERIQANEAFTEIRDAYEKASFGWLPRWDQDAAANDADSDDLSV